MNLGEVDYDRNIYTVWDVFGDVGGLYDMLHVIGGMYYSLICLLIGSPLNRYLFEAIFFFPSKATSRTKS